MALNYVVPAMSLNKHQDFQQVVRQLLKELPADHNDDVEVVIFFDGMHLFQLDKVVAVDGKSYPVRFRDSEDVFGRSVGTVTLTYSQGIYESATLPAAHGCLDVELNSPTKISGFTHHTGVMLQGFNNLKESVKFLLETLQENPKNITVFVTWEGFKPVLLPGGVMFVEVEGENYPVVFRSVSESSGRNLGDVQIAYD